MYKPLKANLQIFTYTYNGEIENTNWVRTLKSKANGKTEFHKTVTVNLGDMRETIFKYAFDNVVDDVVTYTEFRCGNRTVATVLNNSSLGCKVNITW